jgi:uncharacterized membrane protein YraQ (UPF0718 family)
MVAPPTAPPWRRITSLEVLCAVLVLALLAQGPLTQLLDIPAVRTGATVFVAVCVQAMPFLVLGVLVSALIAAFVSPLALRRVLPRTAAAAVPIAGVAGMALPGCECARSRCPGVSCSKACRPPRRWRSCSLHLR